MQTCILYAIIIKILREEIKDRKYEYAVDDSNRKIDIYYNGQLVKSHSQAQFTSEADYLYDKIVEGGSRAFAIEHTEEFLKEIARLTGANVNIEGKVKDDEICFYISGDDARTFIGYKGETLEAVQTVVSHYINKDREERYRVVVDADFYRERRY